MKKSNTQLISLDLLPYAKKSKIKGKLIWDPTRRKWVENNPEELVRQGLIQYFNSKKQFSHSKMRSEYQIKFNDLIKRLDLLLFDKQGAPLLLAEVKSWKVKLDHQVLKQLGTYNAVIQAPYILACNGNWAILAEIDRKAGSANILQDWPEPLNDKNNDE